MNTITLKETNWRWLWAAALLALFTLLWAGPTAVAEAADSHWTATYWNNRTLTGTPVLVRAESDLNYDWGDGRPDPLLTPNDWSARWTRNVYFPAGNYRFTATTDDGMRVYLDNLLIIDSWWDSQVHSLSYDTFVSNGDHNIRVDYYEAGGKAVAKLQWAQIGGGNPGTFFNWQAEYFNNLSLAGPPALVRDDPNINFDWGVGSPAWNVVGADNFSVRWNRTLNLDPGRYRFTVIVDDGVRLWVNGQMLVDRWVDSINGTYQADIDLPGGGVPVRMEYYERVGGAVARLSWQKVGGGSQAWQGEYFNNRTLSGAPVLVRSDANVNFIWGSGSPASVVNKDNFSARWTRSLFFNAGRYRFTAVSDDGVRIWVNHQLIVDGWSDHRPTSFSGEIMLPGGNIPVRIEYYDNTGGAQIQVSWSQIAGPNNPVPTPQPNAITGVVLADRLNIRSNPGLQFPVIHVLQKGQSVTLTGFRSLDSLWVQIHWAGATAWVSARTSHLQPSAPISSLQVWPGTGNPSVPTTGATAKIINVFFLNLRTGPGLSHTVIKPVPAGVTVALIGRSSDNSWLKVQLFDGSTGWMSGAYLQPSKPVSTLPIVN